MMTNPAVTVGIDEDIQESNHMNATLQGFGGGHAISIAVHLPEGIAEGIDADDEAAVRKLLAALFASAIGVGCTVEAQVGRSRDAIDDEGEDGGGILGTHGKG